MSNELKTLIKKIQFSTDKTLEEIADDINYSRAYFNDQVNKGTNKKLLNILTEKFGFKIEQNVPRGTSVEQDAPNNMYSADYLAGKLQSKEEVLAQIEARRQDAEKKANEYLALTQSLIGIIDNKMGVLLTNSRETVDQLTKMKHLIMADDSVVMNNQDVDAGREEGVSATKASKLEIDALRLDDALSKMGDKRKTHKRGRQTP